VYEIIINLKYFVKLRVVKYFWNLFYINFGDKMRKIKSANNLLAKKKKSFDNNNATVLNWACCGVQG